MESFKNQRGQLLIQTLIGIAITGVLVMGIATIMSNFAKEYRAIREELGSNDLGRNIEVTLNQNRTCNGLFAYSNVVNPSQLTFNPNAVSYPFLIDLKAVPNIVSLANPLASPFSNTLYIEPTNSIEAKILAPTTAGTPPTRAELDITYDQTRLVRAIPNLAFPMSIITTPVGGGNVKIIGCYSMCAPNLVMTGIDSGGVPVCTNPCPTGEVMTGIDTAGQPVCTGSVGAPCTASGHQGVTAYGPNGKCCLIGGSANLAYCVPYP